MFIYLVMYHHFEDKQHIFATIIEYIQSVMYNFCYVVLNKKYKTHIDIDWVDFWYRKGYYLSKITNFNKKDVKELYNILYLDMKSCEKHKDKIVFTDYGNVYDDYYVFFRDNTFELEMNESSKDSIKGDIDTDTIEKIKEWKKIK
ncbi:membrane protein [Staphylococcus phage Alsa_1]|nr:membrane protein [Staphylococcus phage Alsa_1]